MIGARVALGRPGSADARGFGPRRIDGLRRGAATPHTGQRTSPAASAAARAPEGAPVRLLLYVHGVTASVNGQHAPDGAAPASASMLTRGRHERVLRATGVPQARRRDAGATRPLEVPRRTVVRQSAAARAALQFAESRARAAGTRSEHVHR